jgi:hypothetical protein
MTEDKEQAGTSKAAEDDSPMSESEIDLNLIETFPASDPPSWTLGTDHRDESTAENGDDESEAEQ